METNQSEVAEKIAEAYHAFYAQQKIREDKDREESEKCSHKISEEDFVDILRRNNGLFAQTAHAIQREYGIPYSRQAVRYRAKAYLETIKEREYTMFDFAKETIFNAIEQDSDKKLRYRAASFLLSKFNYGKNKYIRD